MRVCLKHNGKVTKMSLQQELQQFSGTEQYHKYYTMQLTDGVLFFAEKANAFWAINAIWSYQGELKNETFQSWTLTVKDGKAKLKATDGNDGPLVHQDFDWTDCPEGTYKFYLTNNVLMLPGEY